MSKSSLVDWYHIERGSVLECQSWLKLTLAFVGRFFRLMKNVVYEKEAEKNTMFRLQVYSVREGQFDIRLNMHHDIRL